MQDTIQSAFCNVTCSYRSFTLCFTAMLLADVSCLQLLVTADQPHLKKRQHRASCRLCVNLWLQAVTHFEHGINQEPRQDWRASHLLLNHHSMHMLQACPWYFKPGSASSCSIRRRKTIINQPEITSMGFDSSLQWVPGFLYFGFPTFWSPARAWRLPCMMHRDMRVWDHLLILAFIFCNVNTSPSMRQTHKRGTVSSGETSDFIFAKTFLRDRPIFQGTTCNAPSFNKTFKILQ